MKLPTWPMQGPSRGLPATALSRLMLAFLILARPPAAKHLAVDVFDDAREVADFAVGVDDAGLFAAGRAVADELHVFTPIWRFF